MLDAWAKRHGISDRAFSELFEVMRASEPSLAASPIPPRSQSEAAAQQLIRLEVAYRGGRVWRNNSGAAQDEATGRVVRYGLGNDSRAVNAVFKSSDLIGITPVTCPCGRKYGVFTAYEVKKPGWSLRPGDKRGQAQFNFIKRVVSLGGYARFAASTEDVL